MHAGSTLRRGLVLAGLTSQQQPVLLRLDNNASVLRRAFTTVHCHTAQAVTDTCTSGLMRFSARR